MNYELFRQGGVVMWVLLGCSVGGIALVMERAIFWFLEARRLDLNGLDNFLEHARDGEYREARDYARDTESDLLNRLVQAWEDQGPEALVKVLDLTINRVQKRATRYLFALKTIVSVSPLLGILGTVVGIIQSFEVLGATGTAAEPQAVGAGLAQALVTTAFGLIIAVPCLIAHNYFLAKARAYVERLDESADELAYYVGENDESVEAAVPEMNSEQCHDKEVMAS